MVRGGQMGHGRGAWRLGARAALALLLVGALAAPGPATIAYAEAAGFGVEQPFGAIIDTRALAAGDVDGDGDLDLAVGSDDARGAVYINAGAGAFAAGPLSCGAPEARCFGWPDARVRSVALGDLDGDGALDLVMGSNDGQNAAFLNDGAGRFYHGPPSCDPALRVRCFGTGSDSTQGLALGDVDGDGALDIVVGNDGGQSAVYLNRGGRFHQGALSCAGGQPTSCFGGPRAGPGTPFEATYGVAVADIDRDGDLDIVAGNDGQQSRAYLNDGAGGFYAGPATCDAAVRCFGAAGDNTTAVAAGDLDGDGDFDIVAGNNGGQSRAYLNDGDGGFAGGAVSCGGAGVICLGAAQSATRRLELGDVDADGDLDIVLARFQQQSELFLNQSATFSPLPLGSPTLLTRSVALADFDGDGDLDLAAGTDTQQNLIFRNDGAGDYPLRASFGATGEATLGLAVGDLDGDDDLDFVAANVGQQSRAYLNDGAGAFGATRPVGGPSDRFFSIALGDLDGDRDLDLVAGGFGQPSAVFRNSGGSFSSVQSIGAASRVYKVALGDLDGDGDLDLVVGRNLTPGEAGAPSQIYLNDGAGSFGPPRDLAGAATQDLALGDLDGDGDLDLALANYQQPGAIYHNDGAGMLTAAGSFGTGSERTTSLALGDLDGDGDLDLAAGNFKQPSYIHLNDGQGSFGNPRRFGSGTDATTSLALGDLDGDGDLDLVAGSNGSPSGAFLNEGDGSLTMARGVGAGDEATEQVALGDLDGDGDLDLITGNDLQPSAIYSNGLAGPALLPNSMPRVRLLAPGPTHAGGPFATPAIRAEPVIPISYRLDDPEGDPVRLVRAFYSTDGGGRWYPAHPTADTDTTDLATNRAHTFRWDTFASDLFGQADSLVFRIEAYPSLSAPGGFQRPYSAGASLPFRVRGAQVRVLRAGGQPAPGALVYRIPAGGAQAGLPLAQPGGAPFATNAQGFLQGRSRLGQGDQLVALLPVRAAERYTLYQTSAAPTATGLGAYAVASPGVQSLTVTPARPLILFELDVSVEWDARRDRRFLAQLEFGLRRASEVLYDWSDGQIALGEVAVYQARERWDEAQIRIYASNRLRPNATMGGIVGASLVDPARPEVTYSPGYVRMGAVWNRFGDTSASAGEDWARTLAHELGHYALFLDDNYLGFDSRGRIVTVAGCPGPMSDPYRDDSSEFHPAAGWDEACAATLANQTTGRSDWETIAAFYPELKGPPPVNPGPSTLPLAVTQVRLIEPAEPTATLETPIFYLVRAGSRHEAGPSARAILYQGGRLIDLGRPTLDQIEARGARLGDWLCVYEPAASLSGCTQIRPGAEQLALSAETGWRPDVTLTPASSRSVRLSLTGAPAGLSHRARLYPEGAAAPVTIALTRNPTTGHYEGSFALPTPVFGGHVQVWADGEHGGRELVVDYALGGSPGRNWKRHAPAISGDGQALLYTEQLSFPAGAFYTLQAAATPPPPPAWASPVGRAYRLSKSDAAPDFSGASLNISYLSAELPAGGEDGLRVYYADGGAWRALETRVDQRYNEASAAVQGPGLYMLMSSVEVPLRAAGWNLVAYPVRRAQPVAQALAGIAGAYTTVYGYDERDGADPWKVYDVDAPAWARDLERLEYGRGYWIRATRAVTLPLASSLTSEAPAPASTGDLPLRPATFYGELRAGAGFTPSAGLEVTARVGGRDCGRATARAIEGAVVYLLDVRADDGAAGSGCGAAGRPISFFVAGRPVAEAALWQSDRPTRLALSPGREPPVTLYLPLLRR